MISRRGFRISDYQTLCDFLIAINLNAQHINWNWARFEWMFEHPMMDKSILNRIGLWFDGETLVGAAIFDMFLGEASCLTLPGYEGLFEEILAYAYENLKDDKGLGVAILENNESEIEIALKQSFEINDQKETILAIDLDKDFDPNLKDGFRFYDVEDKDEKDIQWVVYQGFDHGNDREAFEKEYAPVKKRAHLNPYLNLMIETTKGEKVAFCSLWYDEKTDYAYLEPLVVIPKYRHKGLGKAIVYKLLNRAKELGAKKAYVISDMDFYKKLGFVSFQVYRFYFKKSDN